MSAAAVTGVQQWQFGGGVGLSSTTTTTTHGSLSLWLSTRAAKRIGQNAQVLRCRRRCVHWGGSGGNKSEGGGWHPWVGGGVDKHRQAWTTVCSKFCLQSHVRDNSKCPFAGENWVSVQHAFTGGLWFMAEFFQIKRTQGAKVNHVSTSIQHFQPHFTRRTFFFVTGECWACRML